MSFELSAEQMDVLLNFAEDNPHLAFGRVSLNTTELRYEYEFKWKEVMRDINHLDMENARGVLDYRAYWAKLKTRVQCKISRARRQIKMSGAVTKLALTDHELRIFHMIPKNAKDKYLIIEGIEDKNDSKSNISVKTELIRQNQNINVDKGVETILNGLEAIATSIQNVACIQVQLTKGQLQMVQSLNNMAEMLKKIKQDYSEIRNQN